MIALCSPPQFGVHDIRSHPDGDAASNRRGRFGISKRRDGVRHLHDREPLTADASLEGSTVSAPPSRSPMRRRSPWLSRRRRDRRVYGDDGDDLGAPCAQLPTNASLRVDMSERPSSEARRQPASSILLDGGEPVTQSAFVATRARAAPVSSIHRRTVSTDDSYTYELVRAIESKCRDVDAGAVGTAAGQLCSARLRRCDRGAARRVELATAWPRRGPACSSWASIEWWHPHQRRRLRRA